MRKIITLTLLGIFSLSCSETDNSEEALLPAGTKLTAIINGISFAAQDEATAAGFSQSDNITVLLISGAYVNPLSNTLSTEAISILLTIDLDAEFTASSQWYANSDNVIVVGAYVADEDPLSNDDFLIEANTENTDENNARIRITQLDKITKIISGEFEFTAKDEETGQIYTVTNGRFNEVPFENN
ncbi:DUF6252 family protein [uncultured Croceitalea sp.]|uniref:DUF6252 family protein n=1 Tax=uncultured Croceitalea sp. TaxID=1798908 RepID=UPI003305C3D1